MDILTEAYKVIRSEKQDYCGEPVENLNRIASLWENYLDLPVSAIDVCAMMALLKVARIKSGGGYHRDTAMDIAGYAALMEVLAGGGLDPAPYVPPIEAKPWHIIKDYDGLVSVTNQVQAEEWGSQRLWEETDGPSRTT